MGYNVRKHTAVVDRKERILGDTGALLRNDGQNHYLDVFDGSRINVFPSI